MTAQQWRTMLHRWPAVRPWAGTAARVGLAVVWLVAGATKVDDLAAAGRAVQAYELLPYEPAAALGAALPFVELALGGLLLAGLATRVAAAASSLLLAAFAFGIASAWARGLNIDCGCFGGGGNLAADVDPGYALELARTTGLLVLAVFLLVWPVTRYSVDGRWGG